MRMNFGEMSEIRAIELICNHVQDGAGASALTREPRARAVITHRGSEAIYRAAPQT